MSLDHIASDKYESRWLTYAWWLLAALYLTLIAHLFIYSSLEGRCSNLSCQALSFGNGATGALAILIAFIPKAREFVMGMMRKINPLITMSVMAAIFLLFGLLLRPEWIYAHMAISLAALCGLLYISAYDSLPKLKYRPVSIVIVMALCAYLIARILALNHSPSLHIIDEPWTLGWVVSYLTTGQPSDLIMGSVSGSPYYSLPRYYAVVAAWSSIVGIGLFYGRLFSLLVMTLSCVFTVWATVRLYDKRTAAFALFAFAASSLAIVGLRLRHDVGVTLAIATSLLIFSFAKRRQAVAFHSLAGFAAGLGMFAHYHAAGFAAALGVGLYLTQAIATREQKRKIFGQFIAFGLGAAIAALTVLAIQWLPDIEQAREFSAPRTPPDLFVFLNAVVYHLGQIAEHSKIEFILIVVAVLFAFTRRATIEFGLAVALALSYPFLGLVAGQQHGHDYYSVPLIPIFAILIARLVTGWNQHRVSKSALALIVGFVILVQSGYVVSSALRGISQGTELNTPPVVTWIRENVDPSEAILAEHYYFLWLYDYSFLSPLTPNYLPKDQLSAPMTTPETIVSAWNSLAPDYIIVDPSLATSAIILALRDSTYFDDYEQVDIEVGSGESSVSIYRRR